MQWLHLLAKLSPERVQPILREGQCKPPADYNDEPDMPSDHHDSPERFEADSAHGSSSIGDSSLLAPPMSHRQPHSYLGPQHEPRQLQSFLNNLPISQSPPFALATTLNPASTGATLDSVRAINNTEHSNDVVLTNPDPLSPHASWMHGQAPLPNVSPPQQQPLVYRNGYAPVESIPRQTYVHSARTVPSSSAPFVRPGSRGVPALLQAQSVTPPVLSIQTVVPPNSELARSPRFKFAPPGAYVPADPITSTTAGPPSPASARSWRDKGRVKIDQAARQPTQEGSVGRARSNSWTVFPSVFRRRSGRRPTGPVPLSATDAPPPPQLTASNWRDLAHWAYRPSDHLWGESFASRVDIAPSIDFEASSNLYDRSLPPLPSHLSHLPAPSAPLLRTDSSSSALNPFLVHRHTGVPPLSWDLRTSARSVLFPTSSSGQCPGSAAPLPVVPMAASDYAQLATWPPCGALRIGAIGGRASVWRWPVDVRNPVGVRCGDVFRALIANLHEFVRPDELADMPPEHVALAAAAARLRARLHPPAGTATAAVMDDGIRRVDCLLGHTQFCGLVPGPSPGEWTMYVGVP